VNVAVDSAAAPCRSRWRSEVFVFIVVVMSVPNPNDLRHALPAASIPCWSTLVSPPHRRRQHTGNQPGSISPSEYRSKTKGNYLSTLRQFTC
jgi:hypothetical protein